MELPPSKTNSSVDLVLSPLATTLRIDPRLLFVERKEIFRERDRVRTMHFARARAPDMSVA
jgi:hypothetical protein